MKRPGSCRRSKESTSSATAQNAIANMKRVNTVGTSNCPMNNASMIDESPRLRRSPISEATA
jgi:hypothetical protein